MVFMDIYGIYGDSWDLPFDQTVLVQDEGRTGNGFSRRDPRRDGEETGAFCGDGPIFERNMMGTCHM